MKNEKLTQEELELVNKIKSLIKNSKFTKKPNRQTIILLKALFAFFGLTAFFLCLVIGKIPNQHINEIILSLYVVALIAFAIPYAGYHLERSSRLVSRMLS